MLKKVRLNLLIDEELRHEFKIIVMSQRRSMTDVIYQLIRDYVEKYKQ